MERPRPGVARLLLERPPGEARDPHRGGARIRPAEHVNAGSGVALQAANGRR